MRQHKFMNHKIRLLTVCLWLFGAGVLHAQDSLMSILDGELQREMSTLAKQEAPPYYIRYTVYDEEVFSASASFGALTDTAMSRRRSLAVMVRVGTYRLDNSHELRGDQATGWMASRGTVPLPLDLNADALRAAIWRETDRQYRQAVETFAKVKANRAVKVSEEDTSADFSPEKDPAIYTDPPLDFRNVLGSRAQWREKVKKYTAPFLQEKTICSAQAGFACRLTRQYIITSEGTRIIQNRPSAALFISSFIKAADGMELPLYRSYLAFAADSLPHDSTVLADVRETIVRLQQLYNAPVVDPYTGPALLSGDAAGVFFHEIFGHRVEGYRLKRSEDAQTFKKKVGEKVLPDFMSVVFDPERPKHSGKFLNGYYQYDDEGIKSQRVTVVEAGVLKRFLMNRACIEGFTGSNGHGRAQPGLAPVTRQSNLIVETSKLVSDQELRNSLLAECRKKGLAFGLLFKDVMGGFTMTGRYVPNAFNVTPLLVYKVYVDNRPDELVRGVDLVGTPLLMFSSIAVTGGSSGVFNGTCGAESGGVPVSAVSPGLLVTQIEVQKKAKSQERPPVLERPDTEKRKEQTP
jgi:predicted Zn-dependent protease